MSSAPEHEAFQKLTDAISKAESACDEIGALRPDQAHGWAQLGALLSQVKENCFKFVERGLH